MQSFYEYKIGNPPFETLGYIVAVANLNDKHDRSAPSHFHWKVLKCRMIIFSNSSIMAAPDKNEEKQVHVIFNKMGDSYEKLKSLFLKFSLAQEGDIRKVSTEIYQTCFQYTMIAKLAPTWNSIALCYLINNRDFLTVAGPQDGVKYEVVVEVNFIILRLKPVKINLIRADEDYLPGEWIRVLPSMNKAIVENCYETIPDTGSFKSYKDLRRHWKNIHGYRLPEEEGTYCAVQFWRGEPFTYPKTCVTRNFPIIFPMPKAEEKAVILKFLDYLRCKMSRILEIPISIKGLVENKHVQQMKEPLPGSPGTQAYSLCTPTQASNVTF